MQRRNKFLIVPQPKTQCRLENDVLGLSCTAHACARVSVCAACIMYMSCSICLCPCAQAGLHRGTSILSMISNLLDQPFSHCSLSRPRQGVSSIPLVHGWPHGWGCQEAGELLHLSQSDAFPPSSLPPALLSTCSVPGSALLWGLLSRHFAWHSCPWKGGVSAQALLGPGLPSAAIEGGTGMGWKHWRRWSEGRRGTHS